MRPKFHKVIEEGSRVPRANQRMNWFKLRWNPELTEKAACKGLDVELFYPDKDIFTPDEERLFARMCAEWAVMEMCLEWGLAHERSGIWGGTTPYRRNRIRAQQGWVVIDPRTM